MNRLSEEVLKQAKLSKSGYVFTISNDKECIEKYFQNEDILAEYLALEDFEDDLEEALNYTIICLKKLNYLQLEFNNNTKITIEKISS